MLTWVLGGGEWDINLLTAGTLLGGAGFAAAAAYRLRGLTSAAFWWLVAAGFVYLAADEHFGFHERLGQAVDGHWVESAGLHDADGLVMVVYALAAAGVAAAFRDELLAHPRVLGLLVLGAGLTVAAFALDDFGTNHGVSGWLEERSEWLGSVAFLFAFAVRAREAAPGRRPAGDAASLPAAATVYSTDAISE